MDEEDTPVMRGEKRGSYSEPSIRDPLASHDDDTYTHSGPIVIKPKRLIVVEPVLYMYALALIGSAPVVEQYLYARFKLKYPILVNTSHHDDENATESQCTVNHSDPYFIATQAVQEETSRWQMYLQLTCSVIAVFTTVLLGTYSDFAGRKRILLLPSIAAVLKFAANTFVIFFDWPVWALLFGQILEGISGGFTTMRMSVFSYVADSTKPEERGLRITVAEAMLTFAMATAHLSLGYFIKAAGFLYPYITLSAILVINLIYLWVFVPETIQPDKNRHYSLTKALQATKRAFTTKENKRNVRIGLLVASAFVCSISLISRFTMIILFTLNMPLCWGPSKIGIYASVSNVLIEIGGIIILKMFKCCDVPEIWITAIGTVSIIAGALTNAWASTDLMMYIVSAVSILLSLPISMIRTIISRLVRVDEQATLFAGVASIEAFCNIVSALVMNIVYQKTLFYMSGFMFIVGAALAFVGLILQIIYIALFTGAGKRWRGRFQPVKEAIS